MSIARMRRGLRIMMMMMVVFFDVHGIRFI